MTTPKLVTASDASVPLLIANDTPVTASPAERTIEGIIVPFGPAGRTSGGLLTFGAGSLRWSDPKRVKLLVEHDQANAVGYAVEIEERAEGVWAKFHVPEGDPAGDRVLTQAANGVRDAFSVGVMLDASVEHNLRRAQPGKPVKGTGDLRETSMVSVPAFDDARVGAVAASSPRFVVSAWTDENTTTKGDTMKCQTCGQVHAAGVTACQTTTAATETTTAATAAATTTAATETTTTGPETVRAAAGSALTVVTEPATYTFNGEGPSLVRDAWNARMMGDGEAADRIRRFNGEIAGNNPSSVLAIAAVETTTTAPDVVPTLHRPDLMREMVDKARPLISRVNTVPLTNANPFSIPSVGDFTGVDEHTEGTAHAAEGDLIVGGDTVTPRAASGAYRISRELVDSSNPILDKIALRKMLKDYRRHTEAKFYAALVAGEVDVLGIDTVSELDAQLDAFINADDETADFVAVSPGLLTTLKADLDADGRPHLARYAPTNATGKLTGSRVGLVAEIGDSEIVRAGSVAANDGVIVREAGVLWAESKVQQFSFSEVEGPGIVKLALWAYTAAARLDDADVVVITSATA